MYLLTTVFKDSEMAFISYVCINLFISVNTIISTTILYFLGQLNTNDEVRLDQKCDEPSVGFNHVLQMNYLN